MPTRTEPRNPAGDSQPELISHQVERLLRRVQNDVVRFSEEGRTVPHYLPPLARALEEAHREMTARVCDSFHAH